MGERTDEELLRHISLAGTLEDLATQVRAGHFRALSLSWDGGDKIDLKFTPQQAAEFIQLNFVVGPEKTEEA